jgi:hypothetical protein
VQPSPPVVASVLPLLVAETAPVLVSSVVLEPVPVPVPVLVGVESEPSVGLVAVVPVEPPLDAELLSVASSSSS